MFKRTRIARISLFAGCPLLIAYELHEYHSDGIPNIDLRDFPFAL